MKVVTQVGKPSLNQGGVFLIVLSVYKVTMCSRPAKAVVLPLRPRRFLQNPRTRKCVNYNWFIRSKLDFYTELPFNLRIVQRKVWIDFDIAFACVRKSKASLQSLKSLQRFSSMQAKIDFRKIKIWIL